MDCIVSFFFFFIVKFVSIIIKLKVKMVESKKKKYM